MNVDGRFDPSLLYVNFNQDASHISVGTRKNFQIYSISPFKKCYENDYGGCRIVEMNFASALLALVGAGEQPKLSPRTIILWNTKTDSAVRKIEFPETILALRIRQNRLIAICEKSATILQFPDLTILKNLPTQSNPLGILAVSSREDMPYFAVPGEAVGDVMIYDYEHLSLTSVINAHKGTLSALAFSPSTNILATASERGTIIRTFQIPQASKIHTFRRGTYPASIFSLSFDEESKLLSVSSDSKTLHIYRLGQPPSSQISRDWMSSVLPTPVVNATSYLASYLPESLTEYFDNLRDFASASLPQPGIPNICVMKSRENRIMLATATGILNVYHYDSEKGGECTLEQQYFLMQKESDEVSARYV